MASLFAGEIMVYENTVNHLSAFFEKGGRDFRGAKNGR
jgi:hypothetical protein